uniref:Adenosine deaminase domain containing 1 (testis-specific) n=2 Tax=Tetraodon nigroviridis TaxID=99883 RepID=H3D6A0_TETNG
PKVMIDRYQRDEINALSLIHFLSEAFRFQLELKETVTPENVNGLYFAFCALIDGVEHKTGIGKNKKEARLAAAQYALEDFLPTVENQKFPLPETPEPNSHGEVTVIMYKYQSRLRCSFLVPGLLKIPHAVRYHLNKVMSAHPGVSVCTRTAAAFIIHTSAGFEVVAFGTGNVNTEESASPTGRIVHDSHAVVVARRSLMRFLYRHLLMYFSQEAELRAKSIFQQSGDGGLLSLKSHVNFHLYMNQLPKGSAQMPSKLRLNPLSVAAWKVNNEMGLHVSVEGKVFSVLSSAFDHSASKLVSVSITDKLTQWQVLGYQGALISHFVEPIYVQSILVGNSGCTDVRGMEISVGQRVEGITSQLPIHYCVVRSHLSLAPQVAASSSEEAQPTQSVNWSEGDGSIEIVDGLKGKTVEESPFKSGSALASRLCKAAMLHRFRLVAKESQRQELLAASSYREAKRMAKPYQEAKSMLRAHLLQQGFGSWPVKVAVSDNFSA